MNTLRPALTAAGIAAARRDVGPVRQYRRRDTGPAVPRGADPGRPSCCSAWPAWCSAAASSCRRCRAATTATVLPGLRRHRRRRRRGEVHPGAARLQDQRGGLGARPARRRNSTSCAANCAAAARADAATTRSSRAARTRCRRGHGVRDDASERRRPRPLRLDRRTVGASRFVLYRDYHDDEWGRPLRGRDRAVRAGQPGGVPERAVLADHPAQAGEVPRARSPGSTSTTVAALRRRRRRSG